MMTAAEIFTANAVGAGRRCDSDLCPARNPWPIHHVGNRAAFRRLCTACVLRHHRGFFCSVCLEILDSPPLSGGISAAADVSRCLRCPSAVHSSCVPAGAAPNYVCPICQDPEGFPYFSVGGNADRPRRLMDAAEARALLSASRIAAASMNRAAAAARAEAERKAKQAAAASKMAREMLERAMLVSKRGKDGMKEKENRNDGMKENSSSGRINGVLKVKKKKKKKKKMALSFQSGLP
ncbi:hypothetical protein KSP39_PZI002636 [Platanthera zijinensis]|uniref:RING-type domain-containing protein n=1 Tax=Platanthera zijinensis TaxID=2320716 RepID=A0AAP0BZC3_9ASPA